MQLLYTIAEFFLIEWMWSISLGVAQMPFAFFILATLLFIWGGKGFWATVARAAIVVGIPYVFFTVCVVLGLVATSDLPTYEAYEYTLSGVKWQSFIGWGLALLMICLQTLFIIWADYYRSMRTRTLCAFIVISNVTAVCMARAFLPLM